METELEFAKRAYLSGKEVVFTEAYARFGSPAYGKPTEAAKKAKYAKPKDKGAALLNQPRILTAIAESHQQLFDGFMQSPARTLSDLENAKIVALENNDRSQYSKLVELAGKAVCLWSEKTKLVDNEQQRELSAMEEEEAAKIAMILNQESVGCKIRPKRELSENGKEILRGMQEQADDYLNKLASDGQDIYLKGTEDVNTKTAIQFEASGNGELHKMPTGQRLSESASGNSARPSGKENPHS
jgi:hypothetical protein